MLTPKEKHLYTPEEYLILEEKAQYKSEYHQGEIVAMAGASLEHNRIAGNVYAALHNALRATPCDVFMSDLRVLIASENRYTYPDVMVICGEPQFAEGRTDTITNPKFIVEVLSESTVGRDRGDKFYAYWRLDTFEEYVLIDQYRVRVEYFRRVDETLWELRVYTKIEQSLNLPSLRVEIPLSEIYRGVKWET
jgi:Uma2 family endonuclease